MQIGERRALPSLYRTIDRIGGGREITDQRRAVGIKIVRSVDQAGRPAEGQERKSDGCGIAAANQLQRAFGGSDAGMVRCHTRRS